MPCKGCGNNCKCTTQKCGDKCACDKQCHCPCKTGSKDDCCNK
ncbi:metallothionein-2-like [Stomoxys calcitrans]|nr:metallothionein-2-like [Stomoxys calcitrans]